MVSEALLLTRLESLAVVTKSSARPAFVLQSWKSGFHIGTICAVTSDPAQRRRWESTQRFAIQKHKAFRSHTHTHTHLQIRETENMLAQVDSAHMHTNCYFSFVNPPGQKLHMQAFCCLTGAGQTWPGELRIFATHTQGLMISLCKGRRTWSIYCHRPRERERESVCVCGGEICCALWEMGVGIRHNCRMTFCSERFPHRSRGKQRRITQCKRYSTLITVFHVSTRKGTVLCARVCVCVCVCVHAQRRHRLSKTSASAQKKKKNNNLLLSISDSEIVPPLFCTFTLRMHACSCVRVHVTLSCTHRIVWLTTSAIRDNARSDVQCAEYVLMFVCWVRGGEGRIVQK